MMTVNPSSVIEGRQHPETRPPHRDGLHQGNAVVHEVAGNPYPAIFVDPCGRAGSGDGGGMNARVDTG